MLDRVAQLKEIALRRRIEVYVFQSPRFSVRFDGNINLLSISIDGQNSQELLDLIQGSIEKLQKDLVDEVENVGVRK